MKRTVLITGATKGIGLAVSNYLAEKNYHIVGIARHASDGFSGDFYPCDLGDMNQVNHALRIIRGKYPIDIIINNVGIALPQPLGQIDFDSLFRVYDLNVRTAIQVTQFFLDTMKKNRWGRIVNVASRAIFGVRNRTSYAAAKSALVGCTKTWALELAVHEITVNAIAPGPVETSLFREKHPVNSAEERAVLNSVPLGRIGKPQEVAAAIGFLVSEDAGFITGQVLCVDGGSSL